MSDVLDFGFALPGMGENAIVVTACVPDCLHLAEGKAFAADAAGNRVVALKFKCEMTHRAALRGVQTASKSRSGGRHYGEVR